ncbi:MAG: Rne/Rng family ribonuclease [Alphaproteobacteria bacterium]|nr:Rne/Rng family ribonuclease [Alphaproteobacteria bacterium]MDP6518071.1 Rne/Rng family ribonuclease [Alphaproteobacteria bacterium]
MSDELLIGVAPRETRIALVSEGRLRELTVVRDDVGTLIGNIYLGRIEKVVSGIDAAFVDCGIGRAAFLAATDAGPRVPAADTIPRINERVQEGQALAVQVTKDPNSDKGARVTTRLTLPGRYLVYGPEHPGLSISRRIEDADERDRLTSLVEGWADPGGYILRTAAAGAEIHDLETDRAALRAEWAEIEAANAGLTAPALLHGDLPPVLRSLRDRLTESVDRVAIDDRVVLGEAHRYCDQAMPGFSDRFALHSGPEPLFDLYDLESQIDEAMMPEVRLPSGGTLVIEEIQAMTVIDVNTARFTGVSTHDDTVLRTNLEAAREIPWQLRLRNIGGIIVVDFIGMDSADHHEQVLAELGAAAAGDPAPMWIGGVSHLGLVEMTRKRARASLGRALSEPCPACDGLGCVKTTRTVAFEALRAASRDARDRPQRGLSIVAAPDVVALLEGPESGAVADIARLCADGIELIADPGLPRDSFEIEDW